MLGLLCIHINGGLEHTQLGDYDHCLKSSWVDGRQNLNPIHVLLKGTLSSVVMGRAVPDQLTDLSPVPENTKDLRAKKSLRVSSSPSRTM